MIATDHSDLYLRKKDSAATSHIIFELPVIRARYTLFSLLMRFRPKLGKVWLAILYLGLISVLQFALLIARNRTVAVLWIASSLTGMAAGFVVYRYVYWELTPDCLTVRRLWRKRDIPWIEVTDVGWLGSMSGTFRVNVGHRIEDYDRLYIEPSDRASLTAALHKFAPHATFDLE